MKLAVFDFDSTLMDGETIDFLAQECDKTTEVATITQRAMEGELDFYQSLILRVRFLKGLQEHRAKEICENLPLNNGAKEIIGFLKDKGYKVVCFSGGFSLATRHFSRVLGLDADFSNILHIRNGELTGEVGGEMMFDHSKGEMLLRLQNLLGISIENTLCVGDGANDLSMFAYASTRIAFCAKPKLKAAANIIIDTQDLIEIAKYID